MSNTPDWLQNINPGPSFSDEMVRAVMRGDKTQTRRTLDDCPPTWQYTSTTLRDAAAGRIGAVVTNGKDSRIGVWCDYQPGKIYYLREGIQSNKRGTAALYQSDGLPVMVNGESIGWHKANGEPYKVDKLPGIYMPRRAARTFLRITDVRVERVQDISYADVIAEGAVSERELVGKRPVAVNPATTEVDVEGLMDVIARQVFWKPLWVEVNGQESWQSNPWVWVLEFETVTREKAKAKGENNEN